MTNILTIYTKKFDEYENVVNGGLSEKVFIDINGNSGKQFNSIDEALEYVFKNNIRLNRIDFHYYSEDNGQEFAKFNIKKW